jgi:CubicO group peptidase (beta-lactamase class C family)
VTIADPISDAMQSAVEQGVFPGAVLLVRFRGAVTFHHAFGLAAGSPVPEPASLETIYDLASLTKPLATATAMLCLAQDRRVDLEAPVHHHLTELRHSPIGDATLVHLLSHTAGLPGWRPFYEQVAERDKIQPGFLGSQAARNYVLMLIRDEPLLAPPGRQALYSDLGFMLLGMLIERVAGVSLARFVRERVYQRLKADPLGFVTGDGLQPPLNRVAPTEEDRWRGRLLRGEVHDENAYALGGMAGHAGLFGTASAVVTVAGCWLAAVLGRESMLDRDLVRRFVGSRDRLPDSSWAMGWDTPSEPSSSGTKFSPRAFGHLGYTGTSLWVDPERELEVVLLSNRVHPTRTNEKIRAFRPLIHDIICEAIAD